MSKGEPEYKCKGEHQGPFKSKCEKEEEKKLIDEYKKKAFRDFEKKREFEEWEKKGMSLGQLGSLEREAIGYMLTATNRVREVQS